MLNRGLDKIRHLRPEEDEQFELHNFFRNDFRWEPRAAESEILETIEERASKFADELFQSADQALEEFYASIRVPVIEWTPAGEMPKMDENNNLVWEVDQFGEYVENWDNLTGQDCEAAIFRLQRVVSIVQPELSKLYIRAQFSYNVWDDEYWEAYRRPVDGTQSDRTARARRDTRDSRYFYMLQYSFWRIVHDRLQDVIQVKRDIENYVNRRLRDRGDVYG